MWTPFIVLSVFNTTSVVEALSLIAVFNNPHFNVPEVQETAAKFDFTIN